VYVTSTGHEDTFLWVYDQANGALLQKLAMTSQWSNYSAPTVLGTEVYSLDGYFGGVSKFSDPAGTFSWRVGTTVSDGWTPATDGRFAYTYSTPDNKFLAFNATDGSLAYSIGEPYPYSTLFTAAPVMLADNLGFVIAGDLMAFDLTTHTRAWVVNTDLSGTPAFGNATVYAFGANGTVLEARHPKTGSLLWTSQNLGNTRYSSVIVTQNLAFVSSSSRTLAIDLNTHQIVWSYPQGGSLAISPRGVLTILSNGGALATVNLR
jgi:outer membrane protein assembly factor BamB